MNDFINHYSECGVFKKTYDEGHAQCPFCGDHDPGIPLSCFYLNVAQKCKNYETWIQRKQPFKKDRDPLDKPESVLHPQHYGGDTIYETIKVLEAWLTPEQFIGGLRFNALKYLSRAGRKGPTEEDLRKAEFYTKYEVDYRELLARGNVGEGRWLTGAMKK